jgi:hypothetical protein
VLDQVKLFAGKGALIPRNKNYAQQRYEALTGWKAPTAGGLAKKDMNQEQKDKDFQSRLLISKELGHEREQITAHYLER